MPMPTPSREPDAHHLNRGLPQNSYREVAFVDGALADVPTLVAGIPVTVQVFVLDERTDALDQMCVALAGHCGLKAIHLFTHGRPGALRLGGTLLDAHALKVHEPALRALGKALAADGTVLLYGCEVGKGAAGRRFIEEIGRLSGATVAGASSTVGNAALGGHWYLDVSTRPLDISPVAVKAYAGILAIVTGTALGEALSGSYDNDAITALSGDDLIIGGLGDDVIDGGAGVDTVSYAGIAADYSVSLSPAGLAVTGPEGHDSLARIEKLEFADSVVEIIRLDDELQVNTFFIAEQRHPSVTGLADGGFVAVWAGHLLGATGQRYSPQGRTQRLRVRGNCDATGPAGQARGRHAGRWQLRRRVERVHSGRRVGHRRATLRGRRDAERRRVARQYLH